MLLICIHKSIFIYIGPGPNWAQGLHGPQARLGPALKRARVQLGLGPIRPKPKWDGAQVDPRPKWAQAQVGPGASGPEPKWALGPSSVLACILHLGLPRRGEAIPTFI